MVVTEVPPGTSVRVHGLGGLILAQASHVVSINSKALEIKDMQPTLAGAPMTLKLCRQAYESYLEKPTPTHREALRKAYEQVPEHLRRYVGNMDTRDTAVRMILYGEQELEGWSHYQVAQARGEELPSITLPKPEEE